MGSKERTVKSPKTEINGKAVKPAYSRWLFKNIVAVALTLFLLKVVMVLQPTYNWVCFTMLPENMEIVRKYPNLNYDGRMSIKLGANYMYLKILGNIHRRMRLFYGLLQKLLQKGRALLRLRYRIKYMHSASFIPENWLSLLISEKAIMSMRLPMSPL